MVSKQTTDKITGYLISCGFAEVGKYGKGVWIMGEKPHIMLVDLNKKPIEFAISDGISRWTEGHGILKMDEIQKTIEGIILQNEPKPQNPKTPQSPKPCSCHSGKKEMHVHIHLHIHNHNDDTKIVVEQDDGHEEYYPDDFNG